MLLSYFCKVNFGSDISVHSKLLICIFKVFVCYRAEPPSLTVPAPTDHISLAFLCTKLDLFRDNTQHHFYPQLSSIMTVNDVDRVPYFSSFLM